MREVYGYNYQRAAQALKTRYILKLRDERNRAMGECRKLTEEILSFKRTKQGKIYKRDQAVFDQLIENRRQVRDVLNRVSLKYWLLRRIEKHTQDHTAKYLFDVWNSYQPLIGVID